MKRLLGVDTVRVGREAGNGLGERMCVGGNEMHTVHAIADFSRHAADIGANDRDTIAQCFLNDDGRILPPDGGDADEVDGLHEGVDLVLAGKLAGVRPADEAPGQAGCVVTVEIDKSLILRRIHFGYTTR